MAVSALREILARFGIAFEDRELKKGDKAVDGLTDKLGKLGAMLSGGLIVNGLKNMFFGLTEQADALAKQAKTLDLSIEELQSWNYAAGLAGISADEFSATLNKLASGAADKGLAALGVATKGAHGELRTATDILDDVAQNLSKIKNPAERNRKAVEVLGKSYARWMPLLEGGAEGLEKVRAEFAELGGGFTNEFAEKAGAVNDAVSRLNVSWMAFKIRLAGLVLPLVERFLSLSSKVTSRVVKWADSTGILTDKTNLAVAAAAVLGTAFFLAGLKAIAPWLPLIATFAGLILLADELITLWQGGDTLIGRAIDGIFGEGASQKAVGWLKEVVKSTQDFFSDTTRGWTEFRAGVELIWFDLINAIKSNWAGAAVMTMINGSIDGTIAVARLLGDVFMGVWNTIISGADSAAKAIGKAIDAVPGAKKLVGLVVDGAIGKFHADAARSTLESGSQRDAAAIDRQRQAIIDSSIVTRPATATAPVSNATTVTTGAPNINITVPPGTPAQQARAIGAAAANGVKQGNRATRDALVHTAR